MKIINATIEYEDGTHDFMGDIDVLTKEEVKEAIIKYCPGMTMNHKEDCGCVGCQLWKELSLEDTE